MKDYTTMEPAEFFSTVGTDAGKWAEAFIQHKEKHGPDYVTEAMMIGWFANAIMHTHDTITGDGPVVLPDGSAVCVGTIKGKQND